MPENYDADNEDEDTPIRVTLTQTEYGRVWHAAALRSVGDHIRTRCGLTLNHREMFDMDIVWSDCPDDLCGKCATWLEDTWSYRKLWRGERHIEAA